MESVLPLCPNQAILLENAMLYALGKNFEANASKFSTRSTFICKAKGKGGVLLISAGMTIQGI